MSVPPSSPLEAEKRSRRPRLTLPVLLIVLLLDSAYLFIANRASGPPRIELSAFTYEATLLLHLLQGLLITGLVIWRAGALVRAIRARQGASAVLGALTALFLVACLISGLAFLGIGFQVFSLNLRYVLRPIHDVSTAGFVLCGFAYLLARARAAGIGSPERQHVQMAARYGLLFGLPMVALLIYTLYAPNADRIISNPALPPMTAFQEGDGAGGKFFPASAQSVGGQFFPSEYFVDSQSCGAKGCHPDIYAQWQSSAHHRASFNNQWYRKSIEYMQ